MFDTVQDVLNYVKEKETRFVDLTYTNLIGGLHHVTLPVSAVNERLFVEGVGVDGSSIPGFKHLESGDMCVLPDPNSVFIDPFTDEVGAAGQVEIEIQSGDPVWAADAVFKGKMITKRAARAAGYVATFMPKPM